MAGSTDWDDAQPRAKTVAVIGEKLDDFSIADLEQRVQDLYAEVIRVTEFAARKKSHSAAADALFKTSS
jgi:uncharacterized small protein (DUF1192 family)